jgi:ABC-2 type transport system permease protein
MVWPIIIKSIKEQLRNYWILLLTISMAPFFVFLYYLINEASQPSYDVLLLNLDEGFISQGDTINLGAEFPAHMKSVIIETPEVRLKLKLASDRTQAFTRMKNRGMDALLILPHDFSHRLLQPTGQLPEVEFVGDLTSYSYMISAIWAGEILDKFTLSITGNAPLYTIKETALGYSSKVSEFDLWMPGILILSIIMLMFSATIAIITEVDQKTILRLKLSRIKAWQFLVGVGGTQVMIGIIAILLTLASAVTLGFEMRGSFSLFLLIAVLTSVSMIAFSLLLASVIRSVTDVLVVGNFPLFLFMFFTGAAFPIQAKAWFYIKGYALSWQSLMSPTHAINALNKVSIMGLGFNDILPELSALLFVTLIYFVIGLWAFQKRHL